MRQAPYLVSRLGNYRLFWRTRAAVALVRFKAARWVFRTRYVGEQAVGTALAIRSLLSGTLFATALALGTLLAFHFVERSLPGLVSALGIEHTSFGKVATRPVSRSTYDALLGAVAGVTGVFLALYFTAVSAVAAAVYTTVPHDIRALIVRDRLGNAYVRGVAFAAALSVLLLAADAVGVGPYRTALPVIAALAGFSIFAFIRLGQYAFYLADPTLLADTLAGDFVRWLRRATRHGFRWNDANFQEHYRRRGRQAAESLVSLIEISSKREHLRGESLRRLLQKALVSVAIALGRHNEIPTKSRWFGERYEHKQWFLTSSSELQLANQTDSPLQPTTVPDVRWVEDHLLGAFNDALGAVIAGGGLEEAYGTTTALGTLFDAFGAVWSVDDGIEWTEKIAETLLAPSFAGQPTLRRPAIVPALADIAASLPATVEVAFFRVVSEIDVDHLGDRLRRQRWTADGAPYRFNLPRRAVESLEKVRDGLAFERAAGADVVTPGWYARELAFQATAWVHQEQLGAFLEFAERWYPSVADRLSEVQRHDAAGAVLSQGLHLSWKLARHLPVFEAFAERLAADPVLEDLPRPQWHWPATRQRVEQFRLEIIRRMARSIPLLLERPPSPDLPDYFGEAVHRTGEACVEALFENQPDVFDEVFPAYFLGVLATVDRLRPQVLEWSSLETAATWMVEPLLDLVALSGYAIILSEFHHEQRLWEACRQLWESYLGNDGGQERLQFIATAVAHSKHLFAISPRQILRTSWEMRLGALLETLPRGRPRHEFDEGPREHPSALIRRIAPSHGMPFMFFHPDEVFVARYLMTLETAAGLDFGLRPDQVERLQNLDDDQGEEEQ